MVPLRPGALISRVAAKFLIGTLLRIGPFRFMVNTIALINYLLVLDLVLVPDLYLNLDSITIVLILVLDLFHIVIKTSMAALGDFRDLLEGTTGWVKFLVTFRIFPGLSDIRKPLAFSLQP
ncbi:MAG: hypothetical protein J3R72DRAFT_421297 [Linnemannia gamsii]|nr:MAG: hypothetical protein J3R72DRAFT_421297 [Linnemannia gamsii]